MKSLIYKSTDRAEYEELSTCEYSVTEIRKSKDLPKNYRWKLPDKLCGLINQPNCEISYIFLKWYSQFQLDKEMLLY